MFLGCAITFEWCMESVDVGTMMSNLEALDFAISNIYPQKDEISQPRRGGTGGCSCFQIPTFQRRHSTSSDVYARAICLDRLLPRLHFLRPTTARHSSLGLSLLYGKGRLTVFQGLECQYMYLRAYFILRSTLVSLRSILVLLRWHWRATRES